MGDHKSTASEMTGRLADQETTIADLEEELTSLQVGFELERTNHQQQLEDLKGALKAKENESRQLAEKLQRVNLAFLYHIIFQPPTAGSRYQESGYMGFLSCIIF